MKTDRQKNRFGNIYFVFARHDIILFVLIWYHLIVNVFYGSINIMTIKSMMHQFNTHLGHSTIIFAIAHLRLIDLIVYKQIQTNKM